MMLADMSELREKVINGLECCMKGPVGCQQHCGYKMDFGCRSQLAADALSLLKSQDEIIRQYKKADTFLMAHGWKWPEPPKEET